MKTIDDKRLEECREFLVRPTEIRTAEELQAIVRDLTWAVEELQFRRLEERPKPTPEPTAIPTPKCFLLFGSEEAVLDYVDHYQILSWTHIGKKEDLREVMPRQVQAVKLSGTDPELWAAWEELAKMYEGEKAA